MIIDRRKESIINLDKLVFEVPFAKGLSRTTLRFRRRADFGPPYKAAFDWRLCDIAGGRHTFSSQAQIAPYPIRGVHLPWTPAPENPKMTRRQATCQELLSHL